MQIMQVREIKVLKVLNEQTRYKIIKVFSMNKS